MKGFGDCIRNANRLEADRSRPSTASADRLVQEFNKAKSVPEGADRQRLLALRCGDEPELKEQVASLLRAHDGAGDFLRKAPVAPTTSATESPEERIGRYRLLRSIGEGGCGVVYMAAQEEPVRRRVALKVIRFGMETEQVIARFQGEHQALALMDHPHIAKFFEAGATDAGRPYFAMELVRGPRITDYCDRYELATGERLRLFTQVCRAIQHMHRRGIIHRDIKPSNVLVAINDRGSPGHPKVIDFGIAKATTGEGLTGEGLTGEGLTGETDSSALEPFIGTPAYMSPEQAMGGSLDIDARTDIYALGVLLYELLTGDTPFNAGELMGGGPDATRRILREQEPARPSTRLGTLQDAVLATVARQRHVDPGRLGHMLRGDLDRIVMKALEKDRTRRYETADDLARDVERYTCATRRSSCTMERAPSPSIAHRNPSTAPRAGTGHPSKSCLQDR